MLLIIENLQARKDCDLLEDQRKPAFDVMEQTDNAGLFQAITAAEKVAVTKAYKPRLEKLEKKEDIFHTPDEKMHLKETEKDQWDKNYLRRVTSANVGAKGEVESHVSELLDKRGRITVEADTQMTETTPPNTFGRLEEKVLFKASEI